MDAILGLLVAFTIVLAIAYGGYIIGTAIKNRGMGKGQLASAVATLTLGLAMLGGSPTYAQSDSITFDLSPFFTSLNQYLPIFIGLFALIGGIAGAMALAKFVIGAVVDAFSGRGI